ncbi:hypothetical protein [Nocardia pseudobrasiliensis]|uniref:ATP synthase I subunit n=1 Tax=Nocardia pseudobrasiliensis TaxID=45979 RepID=A0A370I2D3_9NOCA|nr:hypothetical protein [Nocardia pseudobrasiliensis]RDI64902.1 hypothetical protein DFR76_107279 [Nocardia pseudobrasiliensis]
MTVNGDRRPIMAAAAGILILAIAGLVDRLLSGVFLCTGMGLGWLNAWLTEVAAARIAGNIESGRQLLAASAGLRLLGITVLALIVAVAARPDGFAILFGLAAFQLLAALRVAIPVLRGAR